MHSNSLDSVNIREILSYLTDNFTQEVFEDENFERYIWEALDSSGKWQMRKCILNASFVVEFVLLLMIYRHLSIANIKNKIIHQFRSRCPELSLRSITPEAFCHARKRLGVEPVKLLFEKTAADTEPYSLFHGLTVVGVDGTKMIVPDTPANEKQFGRSKSGRGEASFPGMKAVTTVESSTRQVFGLEIMPYNGSEREALVNLIPTLPDSSIVLMDRGISAAWLLEKLSTHKKHFLARVSNSWKPHKTERLGDGDFLVSIQARIRNPKVGKKKTRKMKLRLIQYKVNDKETVWLLTDLTDSEKYPAIELAFLYHQRWECEMAYDEVKTHLAATAGGTLDLIFRSKTPDGVLQETYGLFTLYNITRRLMAKAGKLYDADPLNISFVDTVQIIRETNIRYWYAKTKEEKLLLKMQMLRDIAEAENPRPRRKRSFDRVVKTKMSNYSRKRNDCKQKLTDIENDLKLTG